MCDSDNVHLTHQRSTSVGVNSGAGAGGGGGGGVGDAILTMEDLANENFWLREKLKEIIADRDRLLCEVANLRLELDMGELKRLPEDHFPQKVNDRQSPAYVTQSNSGSYVYMQPQHYNSPPQQMIYQHQICHPVHPSHQTIVQNLHKKGSVRGGSDLIKRTRTQNGYELSQDLLDKQIELLERKYGGIKARNAAVTIQRAFRHYTMVKKFASITAMAKAEKRLSRRMPQQQQQQHHQQHQQQEILYVDDQSTSAYGSTGDQEYINNTINNNNTSNGNNAQRVCATITATPSVTRITPVRSMSLRERRSLDASPIPRSQTGNSNSPVVTASTTTTPNWSQQYTHPHVNLLHAEHHYYSTPTPQQYHQQMYQPPTTHQIQQYCVQDLSMHAISQNDSSTHSSMNASWNSQSPTATLQQPYYSAAQIYMRPRTSTAQISSNNINNNNNNNNNINNKRVPPEVPKRTSSITAQQQQQRNAMLQHDHYYINSNRILRPNGLSKTAENGSLSSVQSSGSDSSAERMHCSGSISGSGIIGGSISGSVGGSGGGAGGSGEICSDHSTSPQWKRNKGILMAQSPDHMTGNCGGSTDTECANSHTSAAQYSMEQHEQLNTSTNFKISETVRKRQYRVGLNLFNKKSEKGITYLIRRGFLENTPQGVARFLISRKGLSRQMIGEYLGNLQNPFNMAVLECFAGELDLSGMQVDVALRKFQAYFRMPGEAQKIERLMEIFSQRYCHCNPDIVARLRSSDTVFVMAFAIIMLNTDLHTPNLKPERRMRVEDFIKNLRGIDDCHDIDRDMLVGIFERIKVNEFKPGSDHVTQVMKVQATIVGKKPNLALPHRRLVCYCRLYEIPDINKKERPGVHQREVFLFNDLLVITKIFSKKKSSVTYTFRNSFPLCGMVVTLLDVPNYPYCIRLSQKVDCKPLVTFNARNEHDRCKFAEDLRESISEMDEMETLRIEAELDKQKSTRGGNRCGGGSGGGGGGGGGSSSVISGNNGGSTNINSGAIINNATGLGGGSENRDSGVADVEVCPGIRQSPQNDGQNQHHHHHHHHHDSQLKRSALSNSLLDMHEQFGATEKAQRRGSVGSLDSGMSISFQSTSASTGSRSETKARLMQQQQQQQQHSTISAPGTIIIGQHQHPGFLSGIFNKRERKLSKSDEGCNVSGTIGNAGNTSSNNNSNTAGLYGRSTEV